VGKIIAMTLPDPRPLFTNLLVGTAVVLGASLAAAAPASADPNPSGIHPNLFAVLTCSCQQTAGADGAVPTAVFGRGIRDARSVPLP
jgi:hypothetical protein